MQSTCMCITRMSMRECSAQQDLVHMAVLMYTFLVTVLDWLKKERKKEDEQF